MTIADLHKRLHAAGISEEKYFLHGLYGSMNDQDKLAFTIVQRENTTEFIVYFKEKGQINFRKVFASELLACEFIYASLLADKEIENKYF